MSESGAPQQDKPAPKPQPSVPERNALRCDLCGTVMKEWHCRIICTACGYQRDCSDP